MTEDEQRSAEFKEAIMGVQQGVMDAAPAIWANMSPTEVPILSPTDAAVPIDEPDAGAAWVYERAAELTGEICTNIAGTTTADLTITVSDHTSTNWVIINEDVIRGVLEQAAQDGLPTEDEPQDPQLGFEPSSPLRAEVYEGDDMGCEHDPGIEMGEAEEWFRDKIRVRT